MPLAPGKNRSSKMPSSERLDVVNEEDGIAQSDWPMPPPGPPSKYKMVSPPRMVAGGRGEMRGYSNDDD